MFTAIHNALRWEPIWKSGKATLSDATAANPTGTPQHMARQMTEEKRARLDADAAAARLSDVLESTTDSVLVLDKDWRITYRNRRAIDLVGAGRDISLGTYFWKAYPEAVGSTFQQRYVFAMENQIRGIFRAT